MKRILFHVLFWLAYLSQDTLFAFAADASHLKYLSATERLGIAIHVCVSLLLLKIVFTYLVLYVIIDSILKQKRKLIINIFYIIFTLAVALVIYRSIYIYYIFPVIFNGDLEPQPFWRLTSFFFGLMDLGFVTGCAVVIRQVRLQLAGKEKEKILLREKLETELKFLKNQTNPHFLFNTLNNIYALARKKSDSTPDVVLKLSKILRFMLYESAREFITIGEEIKIIEDYIELEKIRYSERLNIVFKKNMDSTTQTMSPLLLLPFVENAFKHGPSESFYDSFINIEIELKQGNLIFIIENTREQAEIIKPQENNKIGLENIKRQLELMYREYDLNVENQADSFKVVLKVNLNKYGKV